MEKPLRLNLGAGHTWIPGYVNADTSPRAELALDVGRDRLPFDGPPGRRATRAVAALRAGRRWWRGPGP